MHRFKVLSCFALLGCASTNGAAGPAAAASPQETVRVSAGVGSGTMIVDTHPITASARITVDFTRDRVWGEMKAAYDSLGIPITTFDPATHTIGNASVRVRRRLGDVSMSKYVNCGNVQGVQSADAYEVIASVSTRLEAGDTPLKTLMLTTLEAQGRPMTVAAEFVRCSSTGVLETRLSQIVTAAIKR
jgi:hypothetical protein